MNKEEELWLQFKAGDSSALAIIAEGNFRSLLRYGMKFGLALEEVEDLIQDLFLHLWNKRTTINETSCVKNYLFKALRNNIIQSYRDKNRLELDGFWTDHISDYRTIELDWIEKEYWEQVHSKLQAEVLKLPKREKEAIYLRYYENRSVSEIAEIMGVNRQSAANFLQKALQKLRNNYQVILVLVALLMYFL